jgi:hypothetical protein
MRIRILASVAVSLAVIAAGLSIGGARPAWAQSCFSTSGTDPDTGYTYTFPVDNPTSSSCASDNGAADSFTASYTGGQWVFSDTGGVPAGFATVPARITSCAPVIVYAVRGTLEDIDEEQSGTYPKYWSVNGLATDHGLGVIGDAVYRDLSAAEPAGSVAAYSDFYPADDVLSLVNVGTLSQTYWASVSYGVNQGVADLNEIVSDCPSSRVLVTGYSQGADTLRRILAAPSLSSAVASPRVLVELFADPNFNPGEENVPGSAGYSSAAAAMTLRGSFTSGHTGLEGLLEAAGLVPAPAPIPSRFTVDSWCNDQDLICQGDGNVAPQHLTYGAEDGYSAGFAAASYFATAGTPAVRPAAPVPAAYSLGSSCAGSSPGSTRVVTEFDNSGSASSVTYDGTVGYVSNGTVTAVPSAGTSQNVAAGTMVTWSQDLPPVSGQSTFLYDITDPAVINTSAVTPSGTNPPALLDERSYATLC